MQFFTNPLSFSIPPTILVSKLVIVSYSPRMLNIDDICLLVKQSLILNDVRDLLRHITVSLYSIHPMKFPKVIHFVPPSFILLSSPLSFGPPYVTFLYLHFHLWPYQDVNISAPMPNEFHPSSSPYPSSLPSCPDLLNKSGFTSS